MHLHVGSMASVVYSGVWTIESNALVVCARSFRRVSYCSFTSALLISTCDPVARICRINIITNHCIQLASDCRYLRTLGRPKEHL
jgi:hypothetical protein